MSTANLSILSMGVPLLDFSISFNGITILLVIPEQNPKSLKFASSIPPTGPSHLLTSLTSILLLLLPTLHTPWHDVVGEYEFQSQTWVQIPALLFVTCMNADFLLNAFKPLENGNNMYLIRLISFIQGSRFSLGLTQ